VSLAGGAILLSGLIWLAGCQASLLTFSSPPVPASTVAPADGSPIEHVVIIMQENRSFDNLFNGFPGADTAQSGMRDGVSVPLQPLHLGDQRDLGHSHADWWQAWNDGKMDGFSSAAGGTVLPYSYVPRSEVEPYWQLALQYTIGDHMFQANTGPSFVSHQYMIAGQSGGVAENPNGRIWGCDAPPGTLAPTLGVDPRTTDAGVYPCFDYKTMADLLDDKGITWRYYAPGPSNNFFVLSAYQAIRHIRFGSDWKDKVISPQNRVLTDIANGQLAQVTWIVPDFSHSDHPGGSNEGPAWVAAIVNAIGHSKFWGSTAIFISWDDWGGWYDHVPPPRIDDMGPGFRVPVLVVSPWAKHGYVSHRFHEESGFLTFIERNFGLPNLGTRDALRYGFDDCFDYSQFPQPYKPIPSQITAEDILHEDFSGPPDDD
jgi:phospholipase C